MLKGVELHSLTREAQRDKREASMSICTGEQRKRMESSPERDNCDNQEIIVSILYNYRISHLGLCLAYGKHSS